jgi:hypothetical protein
MNEAVSKGRCSLRSRRLNRQTCPAVAAAQPAKLFSWLRSERQRASRNQRHSTVGFDRRPEEAEERGRLEGTLLAALAAAQPADVSGARGGSTGRAV